jgi:hypothetical protein
MPRFALGFVAALVVVALAGQLLLPAYLEGRAEHRLEQDGGKADVSLGAFPAWRLLGANGDRFEAEGKGLEFDLGDRREDPFDSLDGFEDVSIRFTDAQAGPLEIDHLRVDRAPEDEHYTLSLEGDTTPRKLARYLASEAAGPLGGLIGDLAGEALPDTVTPLPIELTAKVESRGGRPDVVDAEGSVAGIPGGPLARIVLEAALRRL